MSTTQEHLSIDMLLDYWLDDGDAPTTGAADEHLMRCDACGAVLDGLIVLGESVREALRAGTVSVVTSAAFVQRLAGQGLRVREYRLPHNGSVNCTVAPEDELLVARLQAPLQGVRRLDARAQLSIEPGVQHELQDLPFDPRVDEVVCVSKIADVRHLPAHTMQVTLLAVDSSGTREVGRYAFNHRPWPGH